MKNIHVLPTDKPSRLADMEGLLVFGNDLKSPIGHPTMFLYRHIYITSGESIEEGDFGLNLSTKNIVQYDGVKGLDSYYKKIILTTDQDLIKDGVQAIHDEFLEWFVKNPSCEFVEVQNQYRVKSGTIQEHKDGLAGYEYYEYKIIIPQEEPKLTFEEYEQQGLEKYSHELKQETLEEAAERISKTHSVYVSGQDDVYQGVIEGAKWQAERMYSEEEVQLILSKLLIDVKNGNAGNSVEWFEQNKKKQ